MHRYSSFLLYRVIRSNYFFSYSEDEASSAPPRFPSPAPASPFHGVDETRELIWALLHEKDEARANYSAETKETEHLKVWLEVAQAGQAAAKNVTDAVRA